MALGKKLNFSLLVRVGMVLKRLPERSRVKCLLPGWCGSLRILTAFLRQRELYSSSREGRGHPMIFWAELTTLWSALLSAAVQLRNHTQMQYVRMLSTEQR